MTTLTKKGLLTPITEKKQCIYCIHVIHYGCYAVKAECEITHQSWGNYTGENMDRRNAERCENFCPNEEVWSNSAQTIVKSKDINWI